MAHQGDIDRRKAAAVQFNVIVSGVVEPEGGQFSAQRAQSGSARPGELDLCREAAESAYRSRSLGAEVFSFEIVPTGLQGEDQADAVGEDGHGGDRAGPQWRGVRHRRGGEHDDRVAVRLAGEGLVARFDQQAGEVGLVVASPVLPGHT